MASPGHEYTVVGYSEEVDRRPLIFVEPLPAAKVCSACGTVPKVIAQLQCEHFCCKPCYEQCLRHDTVVCPLDGEVCLGEEITWINYSARSVMAKTVFCWNHRNGCNVATAAADISRHFHRKCGHHSARCPKCSAEILASDVCAHLESGCDAKREPGAAAVQPGTVPQEHESLGATRSEISNCFRQRDNANSIAMSSIQAELKEISRTVKIAVRATRSGEEESNERSSETRLLQESLNQMRIQTAKLKDQLDEFLQNVNANQQTFHNSFVEKNKAFMQSLTDTVPSRMDLSELATQLVAFREAMVDGQRETKAEFGRLSLAIDRQNDRMSEVLHSTHASQDTRTQNTGGAAEGHTESLAQDASRISWAENSTPGDRRDALALLTSIMPVATMHTWTFKDYDRLKPKARFGNVAQTMGNPVYLRGYCVSVGVCFQREQEVYFLFQLHQGKVDRFLEWPFNLQIRFIILHPQGGKTLECGMTPRKLPQWQYILFTPTCSSSPSHLVYSAAFSTASLHREGFIENGRLLLRLSLEDPSPDDEP